MIELSRILVTGGHGRLGKALGRLGCTALGRATLDVTSPESINNAIARLTPKAIINCAAYTAVDRAETDADKAFTLNRDGPANVAAACQKRRIPLVHISTDCVFGDGSAMQQAKEHDTTAPLSVYGLSKLDGEKAVLLAGRQPVCIARVCWLFDHAEDTFIGKILKAARGRDKLQVVDNAYGRPTPVDYAAEQLIKLAERLVDGMPTPEILHIGPRHPVNRFEWAQIIFTKSAELGGPAPRLSPCPADTFPEPARRPRNLILDTAIANTLLGEMRDWQPETERAVANLLASTG